MRKFDYEGFDKFAIVSLEQIFLDSGCLVHDTFKIFSSSDHI